MDMKGNWSISKSTVTHEMNTEVTALPIDEMVQASFADFYKVVNDVK